MARVERFKVELLYYSDSVKGIEFRIMQKIKIEGEKSSCFFDVLLKVATINYFGFRESAISIPTPCEGQFFILLLTRRNFMISLCYVISL